MLIWSKLDNEFTLEIYYYYLLISIDYYDYYYCIN